MNLRSLARGSSKCLGVDKTRGLFLHLYRSDFDSCDGSIFKLRIPLRDGDGFIHVPGKYVIVSYLDFPNAAVRVLRQLHDSIVVRKLAKAKTKWFATILDALTSKQQLTGEKQARSLEFTGTGTSWWRVGPSTSIKIIRRQKDRFDEPYRTMELGTAWF
jgi:hypothetical protein